jgi:hypothetical protein
MKKILGGVLLAAGIAIAGSAAADTKIGMITTLSGGGSHLGIDVRDGFALALKQAGRADVELIVKDDARKPDLAKQIADEMIQRDKAGGVLPVAQCRAVGTGGQGLPQELLQRRLAEQRPACGDGRAHEGRGAGQSFHPGAELSGRHRRPDRLQEPVWR